ncbi:hypothetical protein ACIRD3_37015 [Kitasatospora sp. NPDC093550]|uniref:hypothetical protein n=1 Tax=Kitasatospora sp. NPDC093550 TaxID=3364089 RepID=UPI00381BF785
MSAYSIIGTVGIVIVVLCAAGVVAVCLSWPPCRRCGYKLCECPRRFFSDTGKRERTGFYDPHDPF